MAPGSKGKAKTTQAREWDEIDTEDVQQILRDIRGTADADAHLAPEAEDHHERVEDPLPGEKEVPNVRRHQLVEGVAVPGVHGRVHDLRPLHEAAVAFMVVADLKTFLLPGPFYCRQT